MPPPMLNAGMPASFYPAMQAAAAAQENSASLVATAKLGPSKDIAEANSSMVVRSSVRKFHLNGGLMSVAQWTRKCVEENLEWLVKLSKRRFPEEKIVLLAYGDGCETLVLMDDKANQMPTDFRRIRKVGIGVSMAPAEFKGDEAKLAKLGVLQPSDSIWEHLRYEQMDTGKDKNEKCLYIHTCNKVWSDSVEGRRRVLQLVTGSPSKPFLAKNYLLNPAFEQHVLNAWKAATATGHMGEAAGEVGGAAKGETLVTFNARELILLEKAFDGTITVPDLKMDASHPTEADAKKAQAVIKRANAEFVEIKRRRARKKVEKTGGKAEGDKAAVKKQEAKTPEKAKSASHSTKKSTEKKSSVEKKEMKEAVKEEQETTKGEGKNEDVDDEEEEEQDSDDEPVSKLKEKVESKKSPSRNTRANRRASSSTPSKAKTPKSPPKSSPNDEDDDQQGKRGRPKGSRNKPKDEKPSKRSASRGKSEEPPSKRRKSSKGKN